MRFLARLSLLLICASVLLFSCTKIEYTTLGVDLVPEVNNVTTFDTTLDVITENFLQGDDSLKLYYNDQLAVGQIVNDPLFGTTRADLYFELKPLTFSASATAVNFRDSSFTQPGLGLDSVVLCLKYNGAYGDTTQAITFQVSRLTDTISRLQDTIYPIVFTADFKTKPAVEVGTKTVTLRSLARDSITINPSSTVNYKKLNELRITLPNKGYWADILRDSTALSGDIELRERLKGFVIKTLSLSTPGALAYFSLSDTATRLQFYYRRKNAGVIDTTSTSFAFNPNNSGYANNVVWDKGVGREVARHITGRADSIIYVKTNPGTQVRIRIPGLENVSNRIIHRAELKTYIIPDNVTTDGLLSPPPVMYLERYDTTIANTYLPIPIDLNPNELYGNCFPVTNGISYNYFGGYPRSEITNSVSSQFYAFNLSRYVQQIVTHQLHNSPLRLTANMNAQYSSCSSGLPFRATNNIVGYGRARLGGGGLRGQFAAYKMRLRIIYSRI